MTNTDLKQLYDSTYATGQAYGTGEDAWHTTVDTFEESLLIHQMGGPWRGQRVLEIGCGEGRLAALLAMSGADVTAIDYSPVAIEAAEIRYHLDGLDFRCCQLDELVSDGLYDRVVMQGVLEHIDDPWQHLDQCKSLLAPGGRIVTSSPHFLNPRGHVFMALLKLLGVPMSLSDLHQLLPSFFEDWADQRNMTCEYRSCHLSWAAGDVLLADFAKRLPNALRDAGLDTSRVGDYLDWLRQAMSCGHVCQCDGATMVYLLR